nr:polysaccharide deacetylase family protein [Clostridia bacterium]
MKKYILALLALCLTLVCAVALAATKPTVSFTAKSGNVNGGFDYELGIKVNKAQEADLAVDIVNNTTGETLTITIPAGETTVSAIISTEVVEKKDKMTFSFVQTDEYTTGTMHTLNILQLPKVQFYLAVSFGTIGKEMSVIVQCNNSATVLKGNNTFTLRDTDGTVLAEKEWSNAANRLTFKFTPDENMAGRHKFTVWLGDYEVSIDDGYGAVSDPEDKAVVELDTPIPLMAIGIDCGFAGRNTDEILAVLEKHNVKCTFFMTGYFLREFPEEAKRILAAGHEIANHSNTHKHMKELSSYNILRQLQIPTEEAEALLGVTPRLFRPPHGEYNSNISAITRAEGMELVMWSATYHDSTGKYTEKQIYSYATTGNDYGPGDVVLCHLDGYFQPDTLDAGLTYYESLGLQVVPISALIYASGGELPAMPSDHEAMVYTDEYWATWLERNLPEYGQMLEDVQNAE